MLFRHPCDLIVHSSALFSFFNHPFPCGRFFFSLFKRNNGSKREGTGNTVRFRRSLRVNRWKSGLLRSRYREPRTASKGISIQRFIFRLYDSSESIRRNSYPIFMRANASQTNPLSGGRDIMAHCSPGKPRLNLCVLELQNRRGYRHGIQRHRYRCWPLCSIDCRKDGRLLRWKGRR